MSLHEEWQKEMMHMKMKPAQKEKIVGMIQQGNPPKRAQREWQYPVVLFSFIAMALLFIVLSIQPDSVTTPITSGQQTSILERVSNVFDNELLAWFSAVVLMVILSFVQLIKVIFQTKRWDNITFIEHTRTYLRIHKRYVMVHLMALVLAVLIFGFWFGYPFLMIADLFQTGSLQVSTIFSVAIVTSYMLYIHYQIARELDAKNVIWRTLLYQFIVITLVTMLMLAVTTVFITEAPIEVLKIWLVAFVAINYCLWSWWMIRDEVRATCPHCGHTFTRREMLKKTFWGYKAKCSQCGEYLYVTKKARKKLDFISWFFPGTFLMLSNLGTMIWLTIGGMVVSWIFIMFVIMPYTMKFSTENEPLW